MALALSEGSFVSTPPARRCVAWLRGLMALRLAVVFVIAYAALGVTKSTEVEGRSARQILRRTPPTPRAAAIPFLR